VWFQDFEDFDDFGNSIVRTYLMTTGYLWTGQFEECKLAVEEGRPQSMELDEKTLQGHWSNDLNSGMEFFIINDAIFSKLCILGDDVEPCFEGASVTAPEVSTNFTNDKSFRKTLFTMMQELYSVLEGGKEIMENEVIVQDNIVQEEPTDFQVNTEDTPVVEEEPVVEETPAEDFTAAEEEPVVAEEPAQEVTPEPEVEPAPAENYEEKYTALEKEYNELQEKYSALEKEKEELVAFKSKIEDAQKDELIEKFSMVSDEDKKDIVENKSQYTLEEIESKLSVICFRKQINFSANVVEQPAEEDKPVVSFNLNTSGHCPEWLSAVDKTIAKKG
jgi:hypothetical protein